MYKTIEECQKDVQKFSMEIDIQYAGVSSILNIIKSIFDILIAFPFYGVIILNAAYYFKFYTISKELLIILNLIIISAMISGVILTKAMTKKICNDSIQAKLDMCYECFRKYEGYKELADSEKIELFEKDICNLIGLVKIK